jgi:23S rRNA (cytidine1920-2'-O)/16S rRNA (cytidine1409-2'-O)-methyltransferase
MARHQKAREDLAAGVRRRWPEWDEAAVEVAIHSGHILVDGRVLANPRAQVTPDASLRHVPPTDRAGRQKLGWAIDRFGVAATGRTALDVGACTGGFTTAWLDAGAARVYAVDVGHGQLLGSLRQDDRVVDLERTNVADLGPGLIPEPVDMVSVDVSYLALSAAVTQLTGVRFTAGAVLLGLVKPMFELRLATIPTDRPTLLEARDAAAEGVRRAGWDVVAVDESPVRGGRGAVEFFVYAALRTR